VRRAAAFALGLIGASEGSDALIAALTDSDSVTRGRSAEALGRIGGKAAGPAIADAIRRALPARREGPLRIRGDDPGRADDPWVELRLELGALARLKDAESFAAALLAPDSTPRVDWWACVWAAMRIGDARLAPFFVAGAKAEDPYIRSLAARGLGGLKDATHLGILRKLGQDSDPGVIVQALRAVATIGSPLGTPITALHIDSPNLVLRREALLALSTLPPESRWRSRIIENVGHADPWIRSAAWPALIRIESGEVGIVLSTIGPDSDWRVRLSVADALALGLAERAAPLLIPMLKDADPRVVAGVLGALVKALGVDTIQALQDHLKHQDVSVRAAVLEGLSSIEAKSERHFTNLYAAAFDTALAADDLETRINVVDAVERNRGEEGLALLRRIAGSDPARVVRQRALHALGDGFAPPEESGIRMADARRIVSLYEDSPGVRYSPRVLIRTRYGRIELALDLVESPLTSLSFVRLARSGYFNGLTFHRVVPGFVAQGGDPAGDGNGGPGFALRCEYNTRPYGRGALGMALSGKDTGGSQFFIALEPQPHLDGSYTQFGQVLSGMEVVDKLRPGDLIERIDVFDGREAR
jgi:cyclophilin family peptidyl-prolyl cis-trans isomerase/HEAT repeat protein